MTAPGPLASAFVVRALFLPAAADDFKLQRVTSQYSDLAEAPVAIDAEEPDRRDFLVLAASAFVAVGGAVTLWPFVQQMNPDAGAQALASIEVDIAPVKVGQAITVLWRGKPVFIRHRTAEEIAAANAVPLKDLVDEFARNDALPETRWRPISTAPRTATRTG